MHNNYYFLKQLTPILEEKILGMEFSTCFSQNKDEMILGFNDVKEEFYIRADLKPEFCCLSFPENFARSKRNSVELFIDGVGKKVISIHQYLNERCFAIHLENDFSLLFKMHGNRSNIILFENNKVISIFRNNLKKDVALNLKQLDRPLKQDIEAFLEADCSVDNLFPTFGKIVKAYLHESSFEEHPCNQKWEILQNTLNQLNTPPFFIGMLTSELIFSLLPVGAILHQHEDPIGAINHFYQIYSGTYYLEKEKNALKRMLERKLLQTENYLQKSALKLNELKNNSRNEELANIIMAGLHQFKEEKESYELFDFYHNNPVEIKLKRGMSPQKLAENYYRKAKNQKLEVHQLMENKEAKEIAVRKIKQQLEAIESMENVKSFRQYVKENNIINEIKEAEEVLPYKEMNYEGFKILVGKNARSNDLLIRKFATKDDLWLHAKDSSGSHVVIKKKSGQNFPKHVIEKAAEIAAYNSKQKNDTLCPVIYTQRKYVRKVKGAAPGAVKVEKENVLLVKPGL